MTAPGAMGAWIVLWSLLGVALAVAGGVWAARTLSHRHLAAVRSRSVTSVRPSGLQEAQEAPRLRYARGEISREDYLQGKVELED
jgi:uncharacterized membrane protein